jgi:heptosyltransferase-3
VKILLIRLRLLGDVVLTTPAVRALRQRFPEARISYLVEPLAADVVRQNPHIDEVLVTPRRRGWRRLADDLDLARGLRRRRFDLVIDFHGGPRSTWLTFATGARHRIGYGGLHRAWAYTTRVARVLRVRHSVRNQWDLIEPLGINEEPTPSTHPVEMFTDPLAGDLSRTLLPTGADIIVVHAGVASAFRRWPVEHYVELARLLLQDHPRRIVALIGGSDVAEQGSAIASAVGPRVLNLVARLSVSELRAIIERAALFIGVDSGPMHVAATTRTPIVALFGPALPEGNGPWRAPAQAPSVIVAIDGLPCRPCDQRRCAPGDFRCMAWISASRVSEQAERILAQHASPADRRAGSRDVVDATSDSPRAVLQ